MDRAQPMMFEGLPSESGRLIFPVMSRSRKRWPIRNFTARSPLRSLHYILPRSQMLCREPGSFSSTGRTTRVVHVPPVPKQGAIHRHVIGRLGVGATVCAFSPGDRCLVAGDIDESLPGANRTLERVP